MYLKTDFIDEHRNIHHNHAIHSTQFHFIWSIEFEFRLTVNSNNNNEKKMFNDDAETDYMLLLVSGYSLDREEKKCKQNFSTKKMIEKFNDASAGVVFVGFSLLLDFSRFLTLSNLFEFFTVMSGGR